jgi:hypothetical protein
MLSYSVGYSPPAISRSGVNHIPSELVGVGRFELPASSSRTKRAAKLRYTPPPALNSVPGEPWTV